MARRKRNNARNQKGSSGKGENRPNNGNEVPVNGSKTSPNTPNKIKSDDQTDGIDKDSNDGKNDVAWYARDPRLVLDAARIPWNKPFGSMIDVDTYNTNITSKLSIDSGATKMSVPGICTVHLKPSFGSNTVQTDPLNVCANALYTHVRVAASGRKNYDPSDLMMYVASFADIYSFLVWCERMYYAAYMYSQRNYYYGKRMLEAEGVNPQQIVTNLANFRYWINSIINRISSYALPGDITVFQRRVFLYSNWYIENASGNMKDQLYQFTPDGFYRFDFNSNNGAGKLAYTPINRSNLYNNTIAYLSNYFDTLMQNVTGDEDFGLMSGDIIKAYGTNLIRLNQINEEGELLPVYDPYVLSQFKNAAIADVIRGNSGAVIAGIFTAGDVEQDISDGLIKSFEVLDPTVSSNRDAIFAIHTPLICSTEMADPDVGDVLELTRLKISDGGWYSENGVPKYQMLKTGTEIAVKCTITYQMESLVSSYSKRWVDQSFASNFVFIDSDDPTVPPKINSWVVSFIQAFKYAPIMFLVHEAYESVQGTYTLNTWVPAANLDNNTSIGSSEMNRIHEVALLSLFYVPGIAKLVS
nr:putative capsid protein [Picobirnavirus sp.]